MQFHVADIYATVNSAENDQYIITEVKSCCFITALQKEDCINFDITCIYHAF